MSFILDALRKSETERRREGPSEFVQVPLAIQRDVIPGWVVAVIVILSLALFAVGIYIWSSGMGSRPTIIQVPAPAPVTPVVATAADVTLPAVVAEPGPVAGPAAAAPPQALPAPAAAVAPPPQVEDADRTPPRAATAVGVASAAPDSGMLQPAAQPDAAAPGGVAASETTATRSAAANLPDIEAVRAAGVTVPQLQLQLHVFDAMPTRRFVMINGLRYGEGSQLNAGGRVQEIVPEGVVINYGGTPFLLVAN